MVSHLIIARVSACICEYCAVIVGAQVASADMTMRQLDLYDIGAEGEEPIGEADREIESARSPLRIIWCGRIYI